MRISKYFLYMCVFFCTFAHKIGIKGNYGKENKLDEK